MPPTGSVCWAWSVGTPKLGCPVGTAGRSEQILLNSAPLEVAEVDVDPGVDREASMLGHFISLVPGEQAGDTKSEDIHLGAGIRAKASTWTSMPGTTNSQATVVRAG